MVTGPRPSVQPDRYGDNRRARGPAHPCNLIGMETIGGREAPLAKRAATVRPILLARLARLRSILGRFTVKIRGLTASHAKGIDH